MAIQGRTWTFW